VAGSGAAVKAEGSLASNASLAGSSSIAGMGAGWFGKQDLEILAGQLPLSLYLQLARAYMQLGHAEYALNTFLQASGSPHNLLSFGSDPL
jgi:hypothetical protein